MPLFQYSCPECHTEMELLVRNGESPVCISCGSVKLEKQLSHITPLGHAAPEPAGCGAPSCCRMAGGGCMN